MRGLRIAAAAVCLASVGCVSIPTARQLAVEPEANRPPAILGPNGMLPSLEAETEIKRLARFPGDDEALQRQVASQGEAAGTPLTAGNKVTLLQNGPATYAAMKQAIQSAKDTINLEFYILAADTIGDEISRLLIEKCRAGVAVQLIYDSQGSHDTPSAFWDRLRAAGVKIVEYNPLNPLNARAGYNPNDRDHRKLLVVDGKLGITGGINITEIYIYGGAETGSRDRWWLRWRDTDVQIEGPAVREMQHAFLDAWSAQKGPPLPQRTFFPPQTAIGHDDVRVTPEAPQKGDLQIYIALLSAIRHARSRVWISTAYFDPTPEDEEVLKSAAHRGVDVELIVQGQSDSQATLAAGRSHYAGLLAAGIKIFERRDVFLHGKTATIDGVWSIVGSSNLDARSVIWNNELAVIVLSQDFAGQMEAAFQNDRKAGTPIKFNEWADRPLGERIGEWSARLLEGLL
ncbi:MAG TPA: phospholipase D-like domain-containing protein [Alphaproteobacteria bacterium]|nr:phospholipase D-like domain-containing protein [Alphaproteobacteria bacterium]